MLHLLSVKMAEWSKNPPAKVSTRRKWKLEDRASLNNLKYHIASEGCSEVQYDLARQLLDESIEKNGTASSEQAVHWLLSASVQGHEGATKLLHECYEMKKGITDENEAEVRCCLSLTPGERAARKAARELFACLSNGGDHITPKKLERKMREIYKMQKKRRRRNHSTSEEDTEEEPIEGLERLEQIHSAENGHIHLHRSSTAARSVRADFNLNYRHHEGNSLHSDEVQQRLITEENLVSAAVNYAAGRMPSVNDALTLSVPHPATLDHVPCFHRILFHPVVFCTLLYHRLINLISLFPASIPPSIRLTMLLTIYWLVSQDNISIYLPVCFYYLCLTAMIWSTCKMLKTKHDFIDFRIWSGLFLSYGDNNIEADISENRFLKNNMKPYLYFFCAFVCNLVVYPLIASEWLPHSEITIISCVFVFVTLLAFMYTSKRGAPDWIVLVSFGVNVLAKYPYEMDEVVTTGWRFLDLKVPTFCSFVIGNGIEFCLNCRTALYLLIPGFLIHLAKRSRWHGTYTYLIPHCVTLSWLQLGITTSRSATMFGVLRATLGLAGVLLFLPLFGIVSLMVPIFVAIEWIGLTDTRVRLGTTVGAAALALLGSCFFAVNRWTQKYITSLQVIICIIAASILTLPYMTSNFKETSRFNNIITGEPRTINEATVNEHSMHDNLVSWQKFYSLCEQPAWEHQNKIKAQLRCSYLNGMNVMWEGTVSHVQISRVINVRADFIEKYLPRWLGNILRCIYGERNIPSNICDTRADTLCDEMQRILNESDMKNKCSLYKWNSYEYEIMVKMPHGMLSKGANVILHGTHKFGNFTSRLVSGDRVQFYGSLLNSRMLPNGFREDFILGTSNARVQLSAIKCHLCQDKRIVPVTRPAKSAVDARMRDLTRGIKYLLNVLLNPLITFK